MKDWRKFIQLLGSSNEADPPTRKQRREATLIQRRVIKRLERKQKPHGTNKI